MNEKQANKTLGDIKEKDGGLYSIAWELAWETYSDTNRATLYGRFTPDQLEAIAWWLRKKHNKPPELSEEGRNIKENKA